MSLQISKSLIALLLLAGCGQQEAREPTNVAAGAQAPTAGKAAPEAAAPIPCRTEAVTELKPLCSAEQHGDRLTLRDAAGGFRRFRIVGDGRGLVAADGNAPAQVRIVSPTQIEVAVDGSLYRLPARLTGAQ